jgi:serine/threonine protein kinase
MTILSDLNHPFIAVCPKISIDQSLNSSKSYYTIFPFLENGPLEKYDPHNYADLETTLAGWVRISVLFYSGYEKPEANKKGQVLELVQGLEYLHCRHVPVIHGDIRPVSCNAR